MCNKFCYCYLSSFFNLISSSFNCIFMYKNINYFDLNRTIYIVTICVAVTICMSSQCVIITVFIKRSMKYKSSSLWSQLPNSIKTSSSAVAKRPLDALCLSVVSLNRITTRAESFIIVT